MNEHPYCPDVIHELLRERQRLPHQSRNPLPQRVVHSFYIARQAAIFADSNMPFARNDVDVGLPVVGVDLCTWSVYSRD